MLINVYLIWCLIAMQIEGLILEVWVGASFSCCTSRCLWKIQDWWCKVWYLLLVKNKFSEYLFFSMLYPCFGGMNLWCSLRALLLHFPHPGCVQSRPRSWSYSAHGLCSLWISVHSVQHQSSSNNRQLWLEIMERWRRKSSHCMCWIEGQKLDSDAVFWPWSFCV